MLLPLSLYLLIHNTYYLPHRKELTDEDIYVGASPRIVARTPRLVVVEEKPWHNYRRPFGPARQYAAHNACMEILLKTFEYRSNRSVNSVPELYRALEKQCWSETAHFGPRHSLSTETYSINSMSWDHGYFGAVEKRHLMSYSPEHCSSVSKALMRYYNSALSSEPSQFDRAKLTGTLLTVFDM